MGLISCPDCGREISDVAPTCPNCGRPLRSAVQASPTATLSKTSSPRQNRRGCVFLFLLAAFAGVGLIVQSANTPTPASNTTAPGSANTAATGARAVRYVHQAVNVRQAPSPKAAIAVKLARGDSVEVDSLSNGWWLVFRDGKRVGYSSESVLEEGPIPMLEISSWNWVKDADFGSDGSVIWTAQVRNNSDQNVQSVRLEFTTYARDSSLITTDYGFVTGIPPGGTRSTKGYATYFGTERKAMLQVTSAR